MQQWFEVKSQFVRIDDDGRERKVSETYLVDAVSVTDAEARTLKELSECVRGDISIKKAVLSNIVEIFPHETGEYWWKAKIQIVTIDESAGKEKKINNYFLVAADNAREAIYRLEEGLSYILVPYHIASIGISQICDVYPYFSGEIKPIAAHLTPLSEVKNTVLGNVGTERRDNYEAEVQQELDELQEVYNSDEETEE